MFWQWLRECWTRQSVTPLQHLTMVMYTRPGCSLCEKAQTFLRQQQLLYRFSLETINITGKKTLEEAFGCQIPVLEVDGKVRFRGVISEVLFQRLLHAEIRKMHKKTVSSPS